MVPTMGDILLLSRRSSLPGGPNYVYHGPTNSYGWAIILSIILASVVVYPLAFARLLERHRKIGLRVDDWLVIFGLVS